MTFVVCIYPSFRDELFARFTPEMRTAVYGVGAEDDSCPARDTGVGDGCVADCFADCGGHGWIEAEDFLTYPVQ